jgi:peptidoglycan/LPS O-acetylase OafA/YrhL
VSEPDLHRCLPTSWAVCLVIGCAARLVADRLPPTTSHTTPSPRGLAASVAAIAALVAASVVPLRGHALTYLVGGPVIAALSCVLLLSWRGWFADRPAALRPLVALGTISYGVYRWNYPVTLWLRPTTGAWAGMLGIAISLAAAAISWRLVEEPIMRRGRRSPAASDRPLRSGAPV